MDLELIKYWKSQLSKIETEVGGELVCLGKDEFKIICGSRPDYEKVKTGYATESECVQALLGFRGSLDLIKELLEKKLDKAWEAAPDKTIYSDHPAWVRRLNVGSLFLEIMTDIDIGIAEGKIRAVLEYEGQDRWEFSESNILDTDTFFSWMRERGYPIPDELSTQKEKKPKQKTIPVPPKTQWHQIHFRIVNLNRIEITTPEGMTPYHPDDLGFTPKIRDLFERFASAKSEYINEDKIDISRLRGVLKTAFPTIEGNPISHASSVKTDDKSKNKLKNIDTGSLAKPTGYRAEFHITEAQN